MTDEQHRSPNHHAPMERLARALGRRLRAPLADDVRARQVQAAARLAATVGSSGGRVPQAAVDPGSQARPRGSRPARAREAGFRRPAGVLLAVGVLVVAGLFARPSGPDLPVLALGSTLGADAAGAQSADRMSLESDAPMDMGLWLPVAYDFVLADGVDLAAGSGPVWRFEVPADLAAEAARLARSFGLGAPVVSEWDDGSYTASAADGASLWVSASGDWFYLSSPGDEPVWDCVGPALIDPFDSGGASGPAADDTPVSSRPAPELCQPPAPLPGVPSEAQARTQAAALLAELGLRDVRLTDGHRDDWSVSVAGQMPIPGVPAELGQPVWVTFGGEGRLRSMSATLARPVEIGDYPTVDARTSLARLQAEVDSWWSGTGQARALPADGGDMLESDLDPAGPTPYGPDAPGGESDASGGDVPDVPDDGAAVPEPGIEPGLEPSDEDVAPLVPQRRTVRIVEVAVELQYVWTQDLGLLLVPHHRLTGDDGSTWYVVAIADRYLALGR